MRLLFTLDKGDHAACTHRLFFRLGRCSADCVEFCTQSGRHVPFTSFIHCRDLCTACQEHEISRKILRPALDSRCCEIYD